MMRLRFIIALWTVKLIIIPALKITKHNATNFPGLIALKLCPDFLKYIGKPETVIAVTGTNGKTTVANLLGDFLEYSGKKIISNRAGSNIDSGISTALIYGCSLFGRPKHDLAVLEVDERSSKKIYAHIKPAVAVVTNLFRDSIMRNAHPGYIADILDMYMPKETKLVLNADDLISCRIAPDNERIYFSLGHLRSDPEKCENILNDLRVCPLCGGDLAFEYLHYHHIGRAVCTKCGFRSPDADILAKMDDVTDEYMTITEKGKDYKYPLFVDNVHNAYNLVTVVAVLRQLGYTHENILDGFSHIGIPNSRICEEKVGENRINMLLTKDKNAIACSRNFSYVRDRTGRKEIFLMMNCLGVAKTWSENPTWMYETDFEFLRGDEVRQLICAGPRAQDYKLRLLLAGISEDKIFVENDEYKAIDLLSLTPGDDIYFLYGVDGMPLAFRLMDKLKAKITDRGIEK